MDAIKFGQQVRLARRSAHLTQVQLAHELGVSVSFIGHIERGTRTVSLPVLVQICNLLHTTPMILLQDSLDPLPADEPEAVLCEDPQTEESEEKPEE